MRCANEPGADEVCGAVERGVQLIRCFPCRQAGYAFHLDETARMHLNLWADELTGMHTSGMSFTSRRRGGLSGTGGARDEYPAVQRATSTSMPDVRDHRAGSCTTRPRT